MRGHITEKILHETYFDLTERARIGLDFLLLTISAAVICALGFRMNNAAVIVGAMVISPLLFPVICAAAATYQADWRALIHAAGTFAIGFLAAIAAAVVVGIFHATDFRSEIVDRLSASRMDYFFVAFFSGGTRGRGERRPRICVLFLIRAMTGWAPFGLISCQV